MKKKYIFLLAFVILALIQLAIPAYMTLSREIKLDQGTLYKIRTGPVDPYDIFRGRYVALTTRLDWSDEANNKRDMIKKSSVFYAVIDKDEHGFAFIKDISLNKPGNQYYDYLKMNADKNGRIKDVFDRFYLNQKIAPKVEAAYRRNAWRSDSETYINVMIKNGNGVIKDLYIDGKPFMEVIEE